MALVTTYATLQTWLASVLNRDDLTDIIPNLIQDGATDSGGSGFRVLRIPN